MVPVARALERAHEHGIVHRDLKPSNIFVTDRGQVKVLDFGIARLVDRVADVADTASSDDPRPRLDTDADAAGASVTFTGTNSLVGTLPYMSPEQWGADTIDHFSDIWAIGIMYWRVFTDVHPVGSTAPDKLHAALNDLDTPLPSLGKQDPTIAAEIVAIVDK